jgi:hypothetical protein
MATTASQEHELRPIEVIVKDPGGSGIAGAHVRATYAYSGLSSSVTTCDDGTATVPLLYCDKEPMQVEAVAPGYHAEAVTEYQPDKEDFKLGLKLLPLESDWEQVTVPLRAPDGRGNVNHPIVGQLQISGSNFHITDNGDVSVNGFVATWHKIGIGKDYKLLKPNGSELTIRFLEINPKFFVTLEHSPAKQHDCAP